MISVIIYIFINLQNLQLYGTQTQTPSRSPLFVDFSASWWYPHLMTCLSPVEILNPNYGLLPYAGRTMFVPCGKCSACLSQRRQMWSFRLQQEEKYSDSAFFVTLTYDDAHVPDRVNKEDVQKFLKRFRKRISPHRVRYFLVSEYGEQFGRPHYHMLLFNYPFDRDTLINDLKVTWQLCDPLQFDYPDVVGDVTPNSISYVCKYALANIISDNPDDHCFMLCSRRPGIGLQFLSPAMVNYLKMHLGDQVKEEGGVSLNLPRYYEKAFTPMEKIRLKVNRALKSHDREYYRRLEHSLVNPSIDYDIYIMQQGSDFDRKVRSKLKNGINQQTDYGKITEEYL